MDIHQDKRPIFATQGGGYAVYNHGRYVWHSQIPNFVFAQVGDPIPEEWDLVPINDAARREIEYELDRELLMGDGPLGIGT